MQIYPAIDLRAGKVVRLTQGDYARMDVYGEHPAAQARRFFDEGARFLHVVDLDGAKDGALSNWDAVAAIVRAAPLFVEVGGGIRDDTRVQKYLELGVGRVILGTAALQDEPFLRRMIARWGERIAVGVDAKDGRVATRGWLDVSQTDSVAFCRRLRTLGVTSVIYTDIARDGAMQGTNLDIYRTLQGIGGLQITASGGISTLDDIRSLRRMGTAAAIVGKALYVGALRLPEVLRAAEGEET